MKIDGKALGEKVLKRLEERGISQAEFAREMEINSTTLNSYITGRNLPSATTLAMMAWMLGVSADYLLGIEKRKKVIELPYKITPNSVLYWNDHTGMPGIVTFQNKEDAEEEYRKLKDNK